MIKDLLNVKEKVKEILKTSELARNSDMFLIYRYWKLEGLNDFEWENFVRVTNPETIIRARAEITNKEGILLPTIPEVMIKRKIKEQQIRAYYSDNTILLSEWSNLFYKVK